MSRTPHWMVARTHIAVRHALFVLIFAAASLLLWLGIYFQLRLYLQVGKELTVWLWISLAIFQTLSRHRAVTNLFERLPGLPPEHPVYQCVFREVERLSTFRGKRPPRFKLTTRNSDVPSASIVRTFVGQQLLMIDLQMPVLFTKEELAAVIAHELRHQGAWTSRLGAILKAAVSVYRMLWLYSILCYPVIAVFRLPWSTAVCSFLLMAAVFKCVNIGLGYLQAAMQRQDEIATDLLSCVDLGSHTGLVHALERLEQIAESSPEQFVAKLTALQEEGQHPVRHRVKRWAHELHARFAACHPSTSVRRYWLEHAFGPIAAERNAEIVADPTTTLCAADYPFN